MVSTFHRHFFMINKNWRDVGQMLAAKTMLWGGRSNGANIRSTFEPTFSRILIAHEKLGTRLNQAWYAMLLFNKRWTRCLKGFSTIQPFRNQWNVEANLNFFQHAFSEFQHWIFSTFSNVGWSVQTVSNLFQQILKPFKKTNEHTRSRHRLTRVPNGGSVEPQSPECFAMKPGAMKSLMWELVNCGFICSRKKWVRMMYTKINHIWTAEMKWNEEWSSQLRTQFMQLRNETWKNSGLQRC